MPADFGVRYVFWVVCRWIYYNPLTLLFIAQAELIDVALAYPAWKWAARVASGIGIAIAQIRNRNKDYTVPVGAQSASPLVPTQTEIKK
jgi:hypothetical protein